MIKNCARKMSIRVSFENPAPVFGTLSLQRSESIFNQTFALEAKGSADLPKRTAIGVPPLQGVPNIGRWAWAHWTHRRRKYLTNKRTPIGTRCVAAQPGSERGHSFVWCQQTPDNVDKLITIN